MKKNKIGIDITDLNPNFYGGLDTYCVNLIKGFSKLKYNYHLVIFLNQKYYEKRKNDLIFKKNITYKIYEEKFFNLLIIKLYNRIFIPFSFLFSKLKYLIDYFLRNLTQNNFKKLIEKNCDILICPAVLLKHYNLNIPTITNLHDIQHEHFKNFFSRSELLRRDVQYHNTAKYTSQMIASGPFMKRDFLRKFPFLKEKINVIYEGVDLNKFKKKKNLLKVEKFFFKKQIYKKKFFFLPAQLWKHKNHITVIKGFEKFNKRNKLQDYKLVFCGHRFKETEYIFDYLKKKKLKNITYLNVIESKKLIWCMQNCISVICPALYESSSLVNLEAIAAKSTIISSDIPTNLEKAKIFRVNTFKKLDSSDLSLVFEKVVKSKKLRMNQIKYNTTQLNKFSWEKTSMKYYQEAVKILNVKK